MDEKTKTHLLNADSWIRLLYMVLFAILLGLARLIIWAIAVIQFVALILTGQDNRKLRDLGQVASKWTLQAHYFLTFNSEAKPFPFDDWPELDDAPASAEEEVKQVLDDPSAVVAEDGGDTDAGADADKTNPDTTNPTDDDKA
ncbi:MAG: DUF4389 domain-containing protein [bacterium]